MMRLHIVKAQEPKLKLHIVKPESARRSHVGFSLRILRKVRDMSVEACVSRSHSLFDVWRLSKDRLRLILARTNGYLSPDVRHNLEVFLKTKPSWVSVEVWNYTSPRKYVRHLVRNARDIHAHYA